MMDEGTGVQLLQGDARLRLQELAPESVHLCVCSPPYHGLRRYLPEGHADSEAEIGLEDSIDDHMAALVEVFALVKKVLRKDACLIVNYGDAYACSPNGRSAADTKAAGKDDRTFRDKPISTVGRNRPDLPKGEFVSWSTRDATPRGMGRGGGLPAKNLLMLPSRLAIALQADGWILRSMLSWVKRSAMPESCNDRPSTAMEYVFIFAKSNRPTFWTHRDGPGSQTRPAPDYRWVNEETGEEVNEAPADRDGWKRFNLWRGHDYFWDADAVRRGHSSVSVSRAENLKNGTKGQGKRADVFQNYAGAYSDYHLNPNGRNLRNSDFYFDSLDLAIEATRSELAHLLHLREKGGLLMDGEGEPLALDVNPQALADAHFASFPMKLVAPLIQAGTSEAGVCVECGSPWTRVVEKTSVKPQDYEGKHLQADPQSNGRRMLANVRARRASGESHDNPFPAPRTTGWQPSCKCQAEVVPATVLDPFAGSGTTSLVASKLGRRSIAIELSQPYTEIFNRRNSQKSLLL